MKMILDEIDLKILYEFAKLKENEFTSTWKIMKKIYKKGGNKENNKIKYRIKRMSKYGLFKIEYPGIYTLDSDKVFLKKINFPTRNKLAICIELDKKWESFEL